MANLSAMCLRKSIAALLQVDPKKMILSGYIKPDWTAQNTYHEGTMGSSKETVRIWGYEVLETDSKNNHSASLAELSSFMIGEKSNRLDSAPENEPGKLLQDVPRIEQYALFIVHKEGRDNWQGSPYKEWSTWQLYKGPNFTNVQAKLEAEDKERWENWVKEENS
jgi:hypothetical protein